MCALAGKRDVHIDLKLDLHESLRQAMPKNMLRLDQAALQVTVVSSSNPPLTAVIMIT